MAVASRCTMMSGGKPPEYWGLTFTAEQANSTISMQKVGSAPDVSLMTSVDGKTWTPFVVGTTTITLPKIGSRVFFMAGESGNSTFATSTSVYNKFVMSGLISASGDISSLLTQTDSVLALTSEYIFSGLFYGCSSLTSAPELPAETLASGCYYSMFYNCSSLTTAPELPADTLTSYCYYAMFSGCSSLRVAPELPATTLASNCYIQMFFGCALTTAPALPAVVLAPTCYSGMFYGCTSLTTAPELPATTLASSCYYQMFRECSSLKIAPAELPATTLASSCYSGMFMHCTSLTAAPQLPATTLADRCYQEMFYNCYSLAAAPEVLPATTLAYYCYYNMFYGCAKITTSPALPATTLADCCYYHMFDGCSRLVTPPALPATTLAEACYREMFKYCSALTTAPALPATTLANSCYYCMFQECTSLTSAPYLPAVQVPVSCYGGMFNGCRRLSYIKINAHSFANFSNWVKNVSSSGTFECCEFLGTNDTIQRGVSNCPSGWTVVNSPVVADYLTFTAEEAGSTISMVQTGSPSVTPSMKYKIYSGSTSEPVATFTPGTTSITLANVGDKVIFYGSNTATASGSTAYWSFNMTGRIAASGSMTTLIREGSEADYTCTFLFKGCTALTSAPELPSTTVKTYGYSGMFQGCTSLTTAPALPAETLATNCYYNMFYGCASLTTAPAVLPAETLASGCYRQMFSGCTSLTAAPALPATTLASNCYRQMFNGCTGLTSAPDLPATTAGAMTYVYQRMFYNCTGLERSGSIAIATATGASAFTQMFYGCSSLKYIELSGMTTWQTMTNWVNGVAANGLFVCPAALGTESTITRGVSKCPTGWRVSNYWGLTFGAMEPNVVVNMTRDGGPATVSLEYSTDNINWNTFDANTGTTPITLANVGDYVCFRAGSSGNERLSNVSGGRSFSITGRCGACGNAMSLINGSDNTVVAFTKGYALAYLFKGCNSLISSPSLPATTLTVSCYEEMFRNCSSLTAAPELPATTLKTLCYSQMFRGCTSLIIPPRELLAANLTESCYDRMFYGCSLMKHSPKLGFTNFPSGLDHCDRMFYNCSSLKEIYTSHTNWKSDSFDDWVNGVAATGTFKCPAALGTNSTITRGTSNCPTGWTVVNI